LRQCGSKPATDGPRCEDHHVSLPTDIIQLFGTGSVPVVVPGSVLGLFELGERLASQRAKDALSDWLLTFDVKKTKALPDGTQELFERIFGERHFTLKCFVRSTIFSVGAMVFLGIVVLLIYPEAFSEMSDALWHGWDPSHPWLGSWLSFPVWLPWSILIDYVSLFKTKVILQILSRMDRNILIVSIAILIADYFFYKLLFGFGFALMTTVLGVWSDASMKAIWFYTLLADVRPTITYIFTIVSIVISGPLFSGVASLYDIFFWSGFAPSIWMWLYVVALFVTRTLLRSEKARQLAPMVP
jgi:hypothetical protein